MAKSKKKVNAFAVHRVIPIIGYRDERPKKPEIVQVFLNREKAQAYADQLEREEREIWEPHQLFSDEGWEADCSLSEEEFLQRIREMGLPPLRDLGNFQNWWYRLKVSDKVKHQIWDLFDRIRFFEVMEYEQALTEGPAKSKGEKESKFVGKLYVVREFYWDDTILETGTLRKNQKLPPGAEYLSRDKKRYVIAEYSRGLEEGDDLGAGQVACFLDPTEAEIDSQKRERKRRKGKNPFYYGTTIESWTSLDEPRLRDWILDLSLDPPPQKKAPRKKSLQWEYEKAVCDHWRQWWNENVSQMSELQISKMWEALDKVRFFEVQEVTE